MRTLLISLCMLLIGIPAFAEDYFSYSEIKDLYVYRVDTEQGAAWIRDKSGNEAVVAVNDTIGAEEAVVVKIDKASITVRSGKNRTKMPIVAESVFSRDAFSDKPILPFDPE